MSALCVLAAAVLLSSAGAQAADTQPPTIDSINITESLLAAGDTVYVNVLAHDSSGVASVTANGANLTKISSNYWGGSFIATLPFGFHGVLIEARDTLGNVAQDSTGGYRTAQVLALNADALFDPIAEPASKKFLFVVCGTATLWDTETFFLDDGSRHPVQINAFAHGLSNGARVRVRGQLSWSPVHSYVESRADWITPL